MDNYIKMCNCLEIQSRGWPLDVRGNLYTGQKGDKIYHGGIDPIETNHIWLPRQEDLQAMMEGSPFEILDRFFAWREFDASMKFVKKATITELWLAFVMHELHRLKWTSTEWRAE